MHKLIHAQRRRSSGRWLTTAALALLLLAMAGPAVAEPPEIPPRPPCSGEGSWLGWVDTGVTFFVVNSAGATGRSGTTTLEFIYTDPTLFGNFPDAVRTTAAEGAWDQVTATTHRFTFIAYGLDATGMPLYSLRGSGTSAMTGCDSMVLDWVMEIFPYPLDPLVDAPVGCMSGTGTETRIQVVQATCEE